mmetsp:Transcript_15560/g.59047  ORF Transcript_15560/g.59047 Transcript_15560/m.59047 type:complete len:215 (+) Transcript_15560:332-976(+)
MATPSWRGGRAGPPSMKDDLAPGATGAPGSSVSGSGRTSSSSSRARSTSDLKREAADLRAVMASVRLAPSPDVSPVSACKGDATALRWDALRSAAWLGRRSAAKPVSSAPPCDMSAPLPLLPLRRPAAAPPRLCIRSANGCSSPTEPCSSSPTEPCSSSPKRLCLSCSDSSKADCCLACLTSSAGKGCPTWPLPPHFCTRAAAPCRRGSSSSLG